MKPSPRQMRWVGRAAAAAEFYGGLMLLLFALEGAVTPARQSVRYLQILLDHQQVQATITDIHRRASSLNVGLAYRTLDDVPVLLRRDLAPRFVKSHAVGDQVLVQYRVRNPSIGRVKDWDLDLSRSFLLPLLLLVAWLGLALMFRARQHWRGIPEPRTRAHRLLLAPLLLLQALIRRWSGRLAADRRDAHPPEALQKVKP